MLGSGLMARANTPYGPTISNTLAANGEHLLEVHLPPGCDVGLMDVSTVLVHDRGMTRRTFTSGFPHYGISLIERVCLLEDIVELMQERQTQLARELRNLELPL